MSVDQNLKISKSSALINYAASKNITWVIGFSILTAISAQFFIPVKPVPFTLQTMVVVLAGAFLGAKNGVYSQLIYLAMGAIGLPVFTQMPDGLFGIAKLFGPTGGYLLAFPLAAYITGYLVETNKSYLNVVFSMFLGNILIIVFGALYLDILFIHNISESLKVGAAVFSLWTVIKVIAGASIYFGLSKKK